MHSVRYRLRFAASPDDLRAVQQLRHLAFHGLPGLDADDYDDRSRHLMIEEGEELVACCRMMLCLSRTEVHMSYSAQFYDLTQLSETGGPWIELGRFCVAPGRTDPDLLRLTFGEITRQVQQAGAKMLFGCSSFQGTDPEPYAPAFAQLAREALAPPAWAPGRAAPEVIALDPGPQPPDPRQVLLAMPPLLRSYLLLGGRVSDHAVIDTAMKTLHVFTGVEIAAIPPARLRMMRALAG